MSSSVMWAMDSVEFVVVDVGAGSENSFVVYENIVDVGAVVVVV